jgi:hypothetical protein
VHNDTLGWVEYLRKRVVEIDPEIRSKPVDFKMISVVPSLGARTLMRTRDFDSEDFRIDLARSG